MTPLATLADLDTAIDQAAAERRAAAAINGGRDDPGTRAALDACRERENALLDQRLTLGSSR